MFRGPWRGATVQAGYGYWLDDVTLWCNAPLSTRPTYSFEKGTSMTPTASLAGETVTGARSTGAVGIKLAPKPKRHHH